MLAGCSTEGAGLVCCVTILHHFGANNNPAAFTGEIRNSLGSVENGTLLQIRVLVLLHVSSVFKKNWRRVFGLAVRSPPEMPASHGGVLGSSPAALPVPQLPANAPAGRPQVMAAVLGACQNVGDQGRGLGSQPQAGPAFVIAAYVGSEPASGRPCVCDFVLNIDENKHLSNLKIKSFCCATSHKIPQHPVFSEKLFQKLYFIHTIFFL